MSSLWYKYIPFDFAQHYKMLRTYIAFVIYKTIIKNDSLRCNMRNMRY